MQFSLKRTQVGARAVVLQLTSNLGLLGFGSAAPHRRRPPCASAGAASLNRTTHRGSSHHGAAPGISYLVDLTIHGLGAFWMLGRLNAPEQRGLSSRWASRTNLFERE